MAYLTEAAAILKRAQKFYRDWGHAGIPHAWTRMPGAFATPLIQGGRSTSVVCQEQNSALVIALAACNSQPDQKELRRSIATQERSLGCSPSTNLVNLSDLHWATTSLHGATSMHFRLDTPEGANCFMMYAYGHEPHERGLWAMEHAIAGIATSVFTFSQVDGNDYVAVEPVSSHSKEPVEPCFEAYIRYLGIADSPGELELHFLTTNLGPAAAGPTAGYTFAMSTACDQAFSVAALETGDEVVMFNRQTTEGADAQQSDAALGLASVRAVGGTASANFSAPVAGYFSGYSGDMSAGGVLVTTPSGNSPHAQTRVDSVSTGFVTHVEGGPGQYDIAVVHASADSLSNWWFAGYGLSQHLDLTELRMNQSPLGDWWTEGLRAFNEFIREFEQVQSGSNTRLVTREDLFKETQER